MRWAEERAEKRMQEVKEAADAAGSLETVLQTEGSRSRPEQPTEPTNPFQLPVVEKRSPGTNVPVPSSEDGTASEAMTICGSPKIVKAAKDAESPRGAAPPVGSFAALVNATAETRSRTPMNS